jgi:hypothetical protein
MNDGEILTGLEIEIALGYKAQQAWNLYIREYMESKNQEIFDKFIAGDVDSIYELKHFQMVLKTFEDEIKGDIERGEFAKQQIKLNNLTG